jgi:hypothetical protein
MSSSAARRVPKLLRQKRFRVLVVSIGTVLHLINVSPRGALPKVGLLFDSFAVTDEDASTAIRPSSLGQRSGVANLVYDLSIVITSNLIPAHPNIDIINCTISSLSQLNGLPLDTPIYITVDGLRPEISPLTKEEGGQGYGEDWQRLSAYIQRVKSSLFVPFFNIHVLAMDQHQHISGSVNEALKNISNSAQYRFSPDNHYIYLLQHDLYFIEPIPHHKLIGAMRDAPEQLRNIRFRYNYNLKGKTDKADAFRFPPCYDIENGTVFERHGLPFYATARWSDNNQLSTLAYYQKVIDHIRNKTEGGKLKLPMEWVLMKSANSNCREWGQAVLGDRRHDRRSYLGHMDGRRTDG